MYYVGSKKVERSHTETPSVITELTDIIKLLVLAWSYHGLVPFLFKSGPGVDTIIKQTTQPTTPPYHKHFKAVVSGVSVLDRI